MVDTQFEPIYQTPQLDLKSGDIRLLCSIFFFLEY